ncbi:hypothetical protein DENSPDRAFT_839321 [Dentipellis sp. KUC8613]|nr:hypothetical protein DENSPDRAFT_839321 [Dentipellis sp. KUC8613]
MNDTPSSNIRLDDTQHSASTPGSDPIHELNALTDQVSHAQVAIAGLFHRLSAEKDEIARAAERQKADRAQTEALLNHLDVFCAQQRAAEQTVRLLLRERDARDVAFKEIVTSMFEEKARKNSEMQREIDRLLRDGLEEISVLEGLAEKFRNADRSQSLSCASPSAETEPTAVENLEVVSMTACDATASAPVSPVAGGPGTVISTSVLGLTSSENKPPSPVPFSVASGWDLCDDHVRATSPGPSQVSISAAGKPALEGTQQALGLPATKSTEHEDVDESVPIPKLKLVDTKHAMVKKANLKKLKGKKISRKLEYATTTVTVERIWVGYTETEGHVSMLVRAFDQIDGVNPFEDLMQDLQVYYQDAPPLAPCNAPYTGQFVSVISLGRWFRAVICSVSELKREAEVELVDYGVQLTVTFQHIRLLPTKFRTMESQTTEARLSHVKPLEGENSRSEEALRRLSELCGRTFSAAGLYSSNSTPYIRLQDPSYEQDENAMLVGEGLAYHVEGPAY